MATLTWTAESASTGESDNSWGEPGNWDAKRVPAGGDSVVVPDHCAADLVPVNAPAIELQDFAVGRLGFTDGHITVAGSFAWTGGGIYGATVTVAGTGAVSGLDGSVTQPSLSESTVTVTGALTVSGGLLPVAGGSTIDVPGTLNLASAGLTMIAGAPATVTVRGHLTVAGTCVLDGLTWVTHAPGAVLSLGAGATLIVGTTAMLHLAGGSVTGPGVLAVCNTPGVDGPAGQVVVDAATSVPNLTLADSGGIAPPAALTVTGTYLWTGGTLTGHVVVAEHATATLTGFPGQVGPSGRLDNAGVLTVAPGAVWTFSGDAGPVVGNTGRITFAGTGGTWNNTGVLCTSTGLIEKTGAGASTVDIDVTSSGNIAVRAGTLAVSNATLTVTAGRLSLAGTTLADDSGALVLAGGVLTGHGTVDVKVTNGGWIEPSAAGLVLTGEYVQTAAGSLTLPVGPGAGAPLDLRGTDQATLDGSLFALTTAGPAAPLPLFTVARKPAGAFRRVRVLDDDHRLTPAYPADDGTVTGTVLAAPGFYGLDFKDYPSGGLAAQHLQDLFDNTPFTFLGFYFPTVGHPSTTWSGHAAELLAQGWTLVPLYVGRQQYWPVHTDNRIAADVGAATAQGTADGSHAVELADTEQLPARSTLYLDVEPSKTPAGLCSVPTAATIAYLEAWLAAVASSQRYVAALYDSTNAHDLNSTRTFSDAVQFRAALGAANPATWVSWGSGRPSGIVTSKWPFDDNTDIAPVAIKRYSTNPQWAFADFAQAWQFAVRWSTTDGVILTDTGAALSLTKIAGEFDFDVATVEDPGTTSSGDPKARRRRTVTGVTATPPTPKPGAAVTLRITLSGPAPAPNGTLVLIRCDSADVLLPGAVRVAAGATTASVTGAVAPGSPAGDATATARTLYQLSGTFPSAIVQVTP